MSDQSNVLLSEADILAIEDAVKRVDQVIDEISQDKAYNLEDFGRVRVKLNQMATLGKGARAVHELEITMRTKPGIYMAGTSLEQPAIRGAKFLQDYVMELQEKRPEYRTGMFKCSGDYDKCRDHKKKPVVCAFLFAACVAERLIPLAGGK